MNDDDVSSNPRSLDQNSPAQASLAEPSSLAEAVAAEASDYRDMVALVVLAAGYLPASVVILPHIN